MLEITLPAIESDELWDDEKREFIPVKAEKELTLKLEHSLVSLSKWESKWCKPFLSKEDKTVEETIDYIRCMTVTQNVDPKAYDRLTTEHIQQIKEYINAPMTATTLPKNKKPGGRRIVTSELIYYWMIAFKIPFECQKWHISRLLTLIGVCEVESTPPKKQSRRETASQYAALNAARRKKFNSKG